MNNDNQQQQKQNIRKKNKKKLNLVLTFCHISFMSADIKNYIFMIIIYLPIQDTIFLLLLFFVVAYKNCSIKILFSLVIKEEAEAVYNNRRKKKQAKIPIINGR